MRKPIAGAVGAVAIVAAAVTACGTTTTTVVRAPEPKPTVTKTVTAKPVPAAIKTVKPKSAVAKTATQAPTPAASTPAPAPAASTPSATPAPGYLGDIFGGGTGNPCNFASGYQLGDCNPTGETEQQYIDNPGGPAPGTSTNAQGCYYVKMGEGYCPSTGQYIPMEDPNGLGQVDMKTPIAGAASAAVITVSAVAGCTGGTTTVKEIPAAAAPVNHAVTPAPAVTKTVAAKPAPTVTQTAPAAPAGASQYCGSPADQGGISVNSVTSCPFAENVESAWESSGGASSVTASSPATGLTYTMSCTASGTGYEVCTGGNNAYVEFPVTSAPTPTSGQFDNLCTQCAVSTLSQSVANEQQAALEAAPSYDYDSPDNASVNVALTPLGDNTYSATATDSDGDTGSGDTITVSPDGNSWSDTGMNWSGPDIYVEGGSTDYWTTPAVSDYS